MNTPPSWMRDPAVLGNWLATRVKFAKNTVERFNQVSRVDAICWFLAQVGHLATAKDIKTFATAFRGLYHRDGKPARSGCYSLLNTCYGGVGKDFNGRPHGTWGSDTNRYKNYGPVSPLYRPYRGSYSPTIGGIRRAARVQAHLDGSLSSAA